jgi:protein CpxP
MTEPVVNRRRRRWIIIGSIAGVVAVLITGKILFCHHHGGWVTNERIERGVRHVLSNVDATPEQKEKVATILKGTANDVTALRERHLADAQRIGQILSAQNIDRQGLEAVRADELSLADQASKRLMQGLADSAEVLTPEQRAKLVARVQSHQRWRNGSN